MWHSCISVGFITTPRLTQDGLTAKGKTLTIQTNYTREGTTTSSCCFLKRPASRTSTHHTVSWHCRTFSLRGHHLLISLASQQVVMAWKRVRSFTKRLVRVWYFAAEWPVTRGGILGVRFGEILLIYYSTLPGLGRVSANKFHQTHGL